MASCPPLCLERLIQTVIGLAPISERGKSTGNVSELRVIFRVRDFQKSVHFYEDLLGLERITSWDRPGEEPGIILRAGEGRTFELFGPLPGGEHDDRIASGVEISMQVDDVDAWHDQL